MPVPELELELEFSLLSPNLEVKVLLARRLAQGTKQRQAQVDSKDLLQAQILGEIAAIKPALGQGKQVRISSRK